jgi:hypothetical protein
MPHALFFWSGLPKCLIKKCLIKVTNKLNRRRVQPVYPPWVQTQGG